MKGDSSVDNGAGGGDSELDRALSSSSR
jgi:hypothetical protein